MVLQKEPCSHAAAQNRAGAAFHMESPKSSRGPGASRPTTVSALPHAVMLKGMWFPWPHLQLLPTRGCAVRPEQSSERNVPHAVPEMLTTPLCPGDP